MILSDLLWGAKDEAQNLYQNTTYDARVIILFWNGNWLMNAAHSCVKCAKNNVESYHHSIQMYHTTSQRVFLSQGRMFHQALLVMQRKKNKLRQITRDDQCDLFVLCNFKGICTCMDLYFWGVLPSWLPDGRSRVHLLLCSSSRCVECEKYMFHHSEARLLILSL
jgi:hypothetical protein